MEELFNLLLIDLKSHIPELKWIDFDFGQLDYEHPPVQFPCALITLNYPDIAGNIRANVEINIKLGFDVRIHANSAAPVPMRTAALAYLKTVKKGMNLKGLKLNNHTALQLTATQSELKRNGIREHTLTFNSRTCL